MYKKFFFKKYKGPAPVRAIWHAYALRYSSSWPAAQQLRLARGAAARATLDCMLPVGLDNAAADLLV